MKQVTTLLAASGGLLAAAGQLAIPPGVVFNMAPTVQERIAALESKRVEMITASEDIVNGIADGEDLTEEQTAKIDANAAEVEKIDKQLKSLKTLLPQGKGTASLREPVDPANPGKVPAQARTADTKRGGFKTFGEFAMQVRGAAVVARSGQGEVDQRLRNAASTWGAEADGADGGFAVPPDFRSEIWQKVLDQENLLTRCAQLTSGGNSITIPKDETSPWDTTAGIQAYWEGEAASVTATKPQLEMANIRLSKLMALVPVSEELLEDAPALESWLRAKAPMKMTAKINTAIIGGTGVGQPLGIIPSYTAVHPSVVSVAEETSQVAATVYYANVAKMWGRMYAPCRRRAVWLINQDVEPLLQQMAFDPKATSKVPVYMPWTGGGASAEPYATLFNRPVVPVEACSTVGTLGDIILADLTQYWAITKGQDVRTDVSMHLYFDQGLMAFRFTFRVNGQPIWGKSLARQNGSNTLSWAVALATRS